MFIAGVIINSKLDSSCYDPSVYALSDLKSDMWQHERDIAVLQYENKTYKYIDLKKLFTEQIGSSVFQTFVLTEDTVFKANKQYYVKTVTGYTLAIVQPGVEVPENTFYQKASIPVDTWQKLQEYLQNFQLLDKYLTVTTIPQHMWITDEQLILTPFKPNTNKQLSILGVENNQHLAVEYGDRRTPYMRKRDKRYPDYVDVVIASDGEYDLKNCIPFVNGCCFYPITWINEQTNKEQMFACGAGAYLKKAMWNTNMYTTSFNRVPIGNTGKTTPMVYKGGQLAAGKITNYNRNIILIDFSSVGTVNAIPLSSTTGSVAENKKTAITFDPTKQSSYRKKWLKGTHEVYDTSYYKIEITLPKGTQAGIPILSLFGHIFFQQDIITMNVIGDIITLTIMIEKSILENIILADMQNQGKQVSGTNELSILVEQSLKHIFDDINDVEQHPGYDTNKSFVIMLYANYRMHCDYIKPIETFTPDKILFPKKTGGILFNKYTRELVDYVKSNFNSYTLVQMALNRPLKKIVDFGPNRWTAQTLGFSRLVNIVNSKYKNFRNYIDLHSIQNYELIDISYMGE